METKGEGGGGQFSHRGKHGGLGGGTQSLPTWECCRRLHRPQQSRETQKGAVGGWMGQEEGQE